MYVRIQFHVQQATNKRKFFNLSVALQRSSGAISPLLQRMTGHKKTTFGFNFFLPLVAPATGVAKNFLFST